VTCVCVSARCVWVRLACVRACAYSGKEGGRKGRGFRERARARVHDGDGVRGGSVLIEDPSLSKAAGQDGLERCMVCVVCIQTPHYPVGERLEVREGGKGRGGRRPPEPLGAAGDHGALAVEAERRLHWLKRALFLLTLICHSSGEASPQYSGFKLGVVTTH
jgi:hypothetical protein